MMIDDGVDETFGEGEAQTKIMGERRAYLSGSLFQTGKR